MLDLNKKQLLEIDGGSTISGAFITSIIKGISSIFDLGKALGTAIRRIGTKTICPL